MGPLLAVVASEFHDVTLTQDGRAALVSLESDRGPIIVALPLEALGALAARAVQVVGHADAGRRVPGAPNIAEM